MILRWYRLFRAYLERVHGVFWHGTHRFANGQRMRYSGNVWLHWPCSVLAASWLFGRTKACRAFIAFGNGDDCAIDVGVAVPGIELYASLQSPIIPRSWNKSRELGVRVFDQAVWLSLWSDGRGLRPFAPWNEPQSRLRQPRFPVGDWLFGREEHRILCLGTVPLALSLPEAEYPVVATVSRLEWKRPRFWRQKRALHVHLQALDPIPVCGTREGGVESWGGVVPSLHAALDAMTAYVLQRRLGADQPVGAAPKKENNE